MTTEKEIECDICKNVLDGSKIYEAGKSEAIKQVLEIYEKLYRENDEVPPEMLKSKIGKFAKKQSSGETK